MRARRGAAPPRRRGLACGLLKVSGRGQHGNTITNTRARERVVINRGVKKGSGGRGRRATRGSGGADHGGVGGEGSESVGGWPVRSRRRRERAGRGRGKGVGWRLVAYPHDGRGRRREGQSAGDAHVPPRPRGC